MIRVESRHQRIPTLRLQQRRAALAWRILNPPGGGGYVPTPPNPNVVPFVLPIYYDDTRREEPAVLIRRLTPPMSLLVPPATVTVPNVVGLDAQSALSALANVSLAATISNQDLPSNVPYNTVFSQSIAGGTQVGQGTIVNLVVQDLTIVPNVLGASQADAQAVLTAAFLTSTVVTQVSAPPIGIVIAQNPPAGTGVAPNAVVTLTISVSGDGFRVMAVTAGWYSGEFRNVGDVFDLLHSADFSDYTLNYEIAGAEYAQGWMMQVAPSTPLTQDDGSGLLVTYDPNRRFVE
jgi:hypothetical protein